MWPSPIKIESVKWYRSIQYLLSYVVFVECFGYIYCPFGFAFCPKHIVLPLYFIARPQVPYYYEIWFGPGGDDGTESVGLAAERSAVRAPPGRNQISKYMGPVVQLWNIMVKQCAWDRRQTRNGNIYINTYYIIYKDKKWNCFAIDLICSQDFFLTCCTVKMISKSKYNDAGLTIWIPIDIKSFGPLCAHWDIIYDVVC